MDPEIEKLRQRMVPGSQVVGLPQYPVDDIKKGQKYATALPRWISGDTYEGQMYTIDIATEDMKGKHEGVVFRPYVKPSFLINSSVPRAEMCSNALLFYDAFRGLCRMRIKYAQFMSEGFEQMNINETITEEWVSKKMEFWSKVKEYWKGKLELSYKWENIK